MTSEVKEMLGTNPAAQQFIRQAQEMRLTNREWQSLTKNLKKLRGKYRKVSNDQSNEEIDWADPVFTKITKREATGSTSETRTALSVPGVQFERLGSQILFSFGGLMGHTRRRTKWTVLTKACPTRSGIANIASFSSPNIAARRSMGKFASSLARSCTNWPGRKNARSLKVI